MSLEQVEEFTESLPLRLRDDILSYARSVQDASSDIFQQAQIRPDDDLRNQLVFLAGIKKLHAICSGSFLILDNSLTSLENREQPMAYEVRIGSLRINRNSREYRQLQELLSDIEILLVSQGITELVQLPSYVEILHRLRNERRER